MSFIFIKSSHIWYRCCYVTEFWTCSRKFTLICKKNLLILFIANNIGLVGMVALNKFLKIHNFVSFILISRFSKCPRKSCRNKNGNRCSIRWIIDADNLSSILVDSLKTELLLDIMDLLLSLQLFLLLGSIYSIPCPFPGRPFHEKVLDPSVAVATLASSPYYQPGEVIDYSCDETDRWSPINVKIQCLEDGTWNGSVPQCGNWIEIIQQESFDLSF